LIQSSRPDLVLCDVGLPGIDGIEVCKRVRLDPRHSPRMIALTGWGAETDRQRTEEAGFDGHLVKPVAMDRLRDVLRSASPTAEPRA
jgi:CheY-like chemotaxis protein